MLTSCPQHAQVAWVTRALDQRVTTLRNWQVVRCWTQSGSHNSVTSSCQCFVILQQSLCLEEAEGKIEPCFYLLIHDVDHAGNARFTVSLSLLLNLEVNYIMGLDYCDRFTTLSAGLVLIVYAL